MKMNRLPAQKNKPKQSQFPKGQNEQKIACRKIWPVFSTEQLELFLFQMVISRRRIVGEYLDGY
jgi:hypothetical protein